MDYKLMYPELSEQGAKNTQAIVDKFKTQLEELINNTLYSFTCNIGNEIVNDDSWIDVREKTKQALCAYNDTESYSCVNWQTVRRKILEENREVVVNDIILDKEKEIKELQEQIYRLQQDSRRSF